MKTVTSVIAFLQILGLANAHYNFAKVIYNNVTYGHWQYVRKWYTTPQYVNDGNDLSPIQAPFGTGPNIPRNQLFDNDMRCNVNAAYANETLKVKPGTKLGFEVFSNPPTIYHPGPLMAYMAKVPAGKTAQNWDGDGKVWFKIYEDFPTNWTIYINEGDAPDGTRYNVSYPIWPNQDQHELYFRIPPATPNGEYLFRIEHLALHTSCDTCTGAQFFISCAQIRVYGGPVKPFGRPGPLVEFPGAYNFSDPILTARIYAPEIGKEKQPWAVRTPGPPVWSGGWA
ncbi:glycoside hydrolase, partial [Tricladium varicosporioides]